MKLRNAWLLVMSLAIGSIDPIEAAYTLKRGRLVDACEAATMSVQDHFDAGSEAFNAGDYKESAKQFSIVTFNFPTTPYGQEAYFFQGASYYYLEEYDFANTAFTEYLKVQSNPRYFQETIDYKYSIANYLASGAKRRFFGTKQLPKWACGKSMALDIYDEVIAAVPCHEIAAQALVSKGSLLWSSKDYPGAIEAFQQVIRRFPKHELAPDCYVHISKVYLEQGYYEFQNPDILAFSEINYSRFQRDFPREERLCEVEEDLKEIKEIYACGLYETGLFYERTCKPRAAIIYYHNAIHQFPDTNIASLCEARLCCIDPTYVQIIDDGISELEPVEGAIEEVATDPAEVDEIDSAF